MIANEGERMTNSGYEEPKDLHRLRVARRSMLYIVRTLLLIIMAAILCIGAFLTAERYSNLYILTSEGMALRAECVFADGARNDLEEYFTLSFLGSDPAMTDATYAAQNMGVGNVKRIKKGVVLSNAYSAIYAVVIYAALFYSCPFFTRIFISGSVTGDLTLIIRYVETYIHLCGLFFIPLGMIFIFRNIMQGCGYSFWPMMGGVTELVCRAVVAVLAAKAGSFAGICWANASAWLITGVFLWICYLFVIRKIEKRIKYFTPE